MSLIFFASCVSSGGSCLCVVQLWTKRSFPCEAAATFLLHRILMNIFFSGSLFFLRFTKSCLFFGTIVKSDHLESSSSFLKGRARLCVDFSALTFVGQHRTVRGVHVAVIPQPQIPFRYLIWSCAYGTAEYELLPFLKARKGKKNAVRVNHPKATNGIRLARSLGKFSVFSCPKS